VASQAWDSRLARRIALPLSGTRVHPNHVTAFGLLVGLVAAACYASGAPRGMDLGALLYVCSVILDHVDGELARATGTSSASGQAFDRFADLAVRFALFAGMGLGLRHTSLGLAGVAFGLAAGAAFVAIFALRGATARLRGWDAIAQPSAGGFELEDILYVIAPVTWAGWLAPFVVAAGIGAPIFALWSARAYLRARAVPRTALPRAAAEAPSETAPERSGPRLVAGRRA
jgi:phosphatidylglycerophosphate synthase